jgi:hypothetical protein
MVDKLIALNMAEKHIQKVREPGRNWEDYVNSQETIVRRMNPIQLRSMFDRILTIGTNLKKSA